MKTEKVEDEAKLRSGIGFITNFFGEERPITVDEACGLRILLFGNTANSFPYGWREQGFTFRRKPSYGIIQKRSGPCGVLAGLQAYMISEFLFGFSRTVLNSGFLQPNVSEKREALARAMTTILWQAGYEKEVLIARKQENLYLDGSVTENILSEDGMLEYIQLKYFRSKDSLLNYLFNFMPEMMKDDGGGCILFVYSLIITHGIDKIKEEMDCSDSSLIGNDGFCSQEMVNLILIGKAVSNLFDGDLELNSGGEETSLHKGIPKQSKIGLLSMFEYQGTCNVGSHYKSPEYPIWVVHGDCHFSVLFGTTRNILKDDEELGNFNLFYFDGYCKTQDKEQCFIIKPNARLERSNAEKDLPVVIRCILTKWPMAEVEYMTD